MYIEFPKLDSDRFHKVFRRRFRMPYNSFRELAAMAADSVIFDRWKPGKYDALGQESTPLPLLILCALRYIGRGWTFDDLSENTGISEEVIRVFFTSSFCSEVLNCMRSLFEIQAVLRKLSIIRKSIGKLVFLAAWVQWMLRIFFLNVWSIVCVRTTLDIKWHIQPEPITLLLIIDGVSWLLLKAIQLGGTTRLLCFSMILLFLLTKVGRCKTLRSTCRRRMSMEALSRLSTGALG